MVAKNLSFALSEILKHEGGYVDNPHDPGGATNMGITRKTLALWRGIKPWSKLPKNEVKRIKMTEVRAIYKARYWDLIRANKLPSGLDLALFDFAVNSGVARAAKTLQTLLKVRRDGIVGVITLRALKREIERVGVAVIIKNICQIRLSFLQRLSIFSTFGRGWKRRVASVLRVSLGLVDIGEDINFEKEKRTKKMNILSGYKTYIMGAFMVVAALGQMAGLDLPGFDGQSATQLLLEAFAIIFLRKGIKNGVGNI